ncbi:hypothetical protein [Dictyobacter arantiisoli]|nr:hypothetical protein [Dictyobacter arantiisoli]
MAKIGGICSSIMVPGQGRERWAAMEVRFAVHRTILSVSGCGVE